MHPAGVITALWQLWMRSGYLGAIPPDIPCYRGIAGLMMATGTMIPSREGHQRSRERYRLQRRTGTFDGRA